MIYQGKHRYPVREVVLHCAAIKTGQFNGMRPFQVFATINRWHTERGFKNGFGYHGLFMPDGQFYSGRPYEMMGAHCIEKNRGTLGFLLIEHTKVEAITNFDDWFTPAQYRCAVDHIARINGIQKVSGHNDYANKLCPGFKVQSSDWL